MNYKFVGIKNLLTIKNSLYLTIFLLILLLIIGPFFLYKSYLNATAPIVGSVDFPQFYHMSNDFWNKKDIFELYREDKSYWFPMWNHLIYIIFYPFTLFSLSVSKVLWFCFNIIFLFLIIRQLKKYYFLSYNRTLILSILSISSTPFTNTLGNGQLGLFLLLCIIFYWYSKIKIKKLFLSIAYIKLSFAPFFLINSLLKKETDLMYAILISVSAVIFYSLYINDFSFVQFINPLLVIYEVNKETITNFTGVGNIKTMFMMLGLYQYYSFALIIFVIASLMSIFLIKKNNDFLFLTIIMASLLAFYHNFYDFVFLIPLAAFILKSDTSKIIVSINLPVILWFFYLVRFNQLILNNYFSVELINLISCFLLFISFLSLNFTNYNFFRNNLLNFKKIFLKK
jgi:hypothetical protein